MQNFKQKKILYIVKESFVTFWLSAKRFETLNYKVEIVNLF